MKVKWFASVGRSRKSGSNDVSSEKCRCSQDPWPSQGRLIEANTTPSSHDNTAKKDGKAASPDQESALKVCGGNNRTNKSSH